MSNRVTELIKYNSESHSLDFKKEQYPIQSSEKKNELLKDISSMANHPSNDDKYIIVGVKASNGMASTFHNIPELVDEAKYQQFVNSCIEPSINFEYFRVQYEGYDLAAFRIYGNNDRPYLFKRDVPKFGRSDEQEFRVGDGQIRQGTSTRKLTRADLELIYSNKLQGRDRKADLVVTPVILASDDDEINSYEFSCFDVRIENRSSKSIELDIEVRILKEKSLEVLQECDFKKKLYAKQVELQSDRGLLGLASVQPGIHFSFDVSVEQTNTHFIAKRDRRRGEQATISIPQHDVEANAFCKELIILSDRSGTISGEIVIRSNDFVEGGLTSAFSIDYKKIPDRG